MTYSMPELIGTKREGGSLTADELEWIIAGYTADQIPDYQLLSLIHISEPTRPTRASRMPSSA